MVEQIALPLVVSVTNSGLLITGAFRLCNIYANRRWANGGRTKAETLHAKEVLGLGLAKFAYTVAQENGGIEVAEAAYNHHTDTTGGDTVKSSEPQRQRIVTGRALLLGTLGAIVVGLLAPWAIHVLRGSYMALDFSTPAAVALLFVLVAGPNLLLLRFRRNLALTTAELITIYSMMVVASAIPTMGLTAQVIPLSTGPYYYASPENAWAQRIIPYVPDWLTPRGSGVDAPVITNLYEGLPAGAQVPWGAWVRPLLSWLPMLLIVHFVMICMMVLLRKQWVDNERLAYPLTYLPLALAGADSGGWPVILKRSTFWIGFAIAFLGGSWVGLHNYFPAVPAAKWDQSVTLIKGIWSLSFRISFPMIGFFYLVNLETSFSLWFFNLLAQVVRAIMGVVGITSTENLGVYGARDPILKYIGAGAFLALVASGLWVARGHLKVVWRQAIGKADPQLDEREILSYRVAFWGMIVGLGLIAWWLAASGLPATVVPLFLILAFVFFLGLTRIVAESGMAEAVAPAIAPTTVAGLLGWGPLGDRGVVSLALTYVWTSDIRTFVMASAANSLKLADVIEGKQRRLFWGFILAIIAALAASMWLTMTRAYTQGGVTMNSWFFDGAVQAAYKWAQEWIVKRPEPSVAGLIYTAIGAGIYLVLTALRFRWANWPFHPIGYCIGSVWIMDNIWFTIFLTWLTKAAILRYGGMVWYSNLRPVFLGLICGQFVCNAAWLILDWATGHTGNAVFWI